MDAVKGLLGSLAALVARFSPFGGQTPAMREILKDAAPYAAIILIVPGGMLFALLYWFYRRRGAIAGPGAASQRPCALVQGAGRQRT